MYISFHKFRGCVCHRKEMYLHLYQSAGFKNEFLSWFIFVYLMIFCYLRSLCASNCKVILNIEFEATWKTTVLTYLKILLRNSLWEIRKSMKIFRVDNKFLEIRSRDFTNVNRRWSKDQWFMLVTVFATDRLLQVAKFHLNFRSSVAKLNHYSCHKMPDRQTPLLMNSWLRSAVQYRQTGLYKTV